MDAAQILIWLLVFLVITLIALVIYALVLMIEVRQSLHRADYLLAKIESVVNFVENKLVKTGSNAGLYLVAIKEFLNFTTSLRGAFKKESSKAKKEE